MSTQSHEPIDLSKYMHILEWASWRFARAEGVPTRDSMAFSDACDAAIEIAASYDPGKGYSFEKYLSSLIKIRMVDRLRHRCGRKNSKRRMNQILTVSLDETYESPNYGESLSVHDLIEDKEASEDARAIAWADDVESLLSRMSNQQVATCIREYFLHGKTMKETGRIAGISESRVSQIFSKLGDTVLGPFLRPTV